MPSLQVKDVRHRFQGKPILHGVSLEAKSGEIVAIIGPSGCGKTTLLRCILGELEPESGQVIVDGEDITGQSVWRRGVGIVYQRYALFPHMTVADNVAYGLKVKGWSEARSRNRTRELLQLVKLEHKALKFPDQLSGGERQRVALVRALAVEPRILLLDEAFTALDASTRHTVIQEVRAIIRRLGVTTVLVTHDQEEAFLFATRVVVLNEGRLVATGSPQEVMKHPHPFIQDFVKMAMFHEGTVQQDAVGRRFVELGGGNRIPVNITGVNVGEGVQVVVKKTGDTERIEVWPHARRD